MSAPRLERRLAAVLAADVVGYSRLMEQDERGTFDRLKAHRKETIEPLVAQHHGRIVKFTGDGALCEFHSVVEAVTWLIGAQDDHRKRSALPSTLPGRAGARSAIDRKSTLEPLSLIRGPLLDALALEAVVNRINPEPDVHM